MITFGVSTALLIAAYFIYGAILEKILGVDPARPVPAVTKSDGVDFVPISWPRVFLIQLLNIAGLGPVFGAVAGALWGPVVFLWIVFGGIFIGSVHDFVAAFISIREGGASLTEIIGKYLGPVVRKIMILWVVVLLMLVGVAFTTGPASIMADVCKTGKVESTAAMTPDLDVPVGTETATVSSPATISASVPASAQPPVPIYQTTFFWAVIIFAYYVLATLIPIDKLIGRIYPLFGAALLTMVGMITWRIVNGSLHIPELTLQNLHPAGVGVWPFMMITVACGAISGFHATQSPMMARAIESEGYSRRIFFGAMLCESFIALVWAGAAIGICEGSTAILNQVLGPKGEAVMLVKKVSQLFGLMGSVIILLGVVALPVTTGDTAYRSARLTLAEFFGVDQGPIKNRLMISLPMFAVGIFLTTVDFKVIWLYFAWLNQSLSVFTLWAATVYLYRNGRNWFVTAVPALFMSTVCATYILIDEKRGFALNGTLGLVLAILFSISCAFLVTRFASKGSQAAPVPSAG